VKDGQGGRTTFRQKQTKVSSTRGRGKEKKRSSNGWKSDQKEKEGMRNAADETTEKIFGLKKRRRGNFTKR